MAAITALARGWDSAERSSDADLVDALLGASSSPAIGRGLVAIRDGQCLTCTFDPDRLTDRGLSAALERVGSYAGSARLIYRHGGAWAGEDHQRGLAAAERLEQIASRRNVTRLRGLVTRLDTGLAETAHPLLSLTWKDWDRNKGLVGDRAAGQEAVLPYMQLSAPDRHGEGQRFVFVGHRTTSIRTFGREWCNNAWAGWAGVPDMQLESAVTGVYREVLETGEPRLHDVFTTVRRPDGERVHLPYRRLVLPCTLSTGAPLFNCATHFLPPDLAAVP